MNESPIARTLPEEPITQEVTVAHASLVLRHAGGAMVASLSPARAITVGRRLPADVIIDDQSVALQHARFSLASDGLSVEDLGSRSGTWVGGESIKCARLCSGQSVRLGNVTATVHLAAQPAVGSVGGGLQPVIHSDGTRVLYELASQLAPTALPVLIAGEPGVGKRLVAAVVHAESGRRGGLHVIDCSLVSPFARDPETDASAVERAAGGSLVLQNVGSLSSADQAALQTLLQTGRPAANAPRVDVRLIAIEARDLGALVSEGRFRGDLRQRLSALTLRIDPLRERRDEIEPLVNRFLTEVARTWGRPPRRIAAAALARLHEVPWPGNVAQLRVAIEHADLVCAGDAIDLPDLPRELNLAPNPLPQLAPGDSSGAPTHVLPPSEAEANRIGLDFKGRIREYEVRMIVDALRRTGGNQRATARLLRIPLRTLAHKIKAYAIKHRLAVEVARERGVSA